MRWSIREAIDVTFKARSTFQLGARTFRAGEPVLIFDTVKTGTYEVAAETSYVTGGRGNYRILAFEGDKTLTFTFEEALLSAEGLAILAGANLLPARNKNLPGASADARSVIAHRTERTTISVGNRIDTDTNNVFPDDPALGAAGDRSPMGGVLNVWLPEKPYVGQNASIYVMLLDKAGEISGAPIEINLNSVKGDGEGQVDDAHSYLAKFDRAGTNTFIAFGKDGNPMSLTDYPNPTTGQQQAVFDDMVAHYVDVTSATASWSTAWGAVADITTNYVRTIGGTGAGGWDFTANGLYGYLIAPSGGVGQPVAFREGGRFVYKANVPSVMYNDIILLDYYKEYMHNATQISILPDKFAPYMYVEGSSLVKRSFDGMDLPIEFVIPKFKVMTALTFNLQSTGDASTFSFQGDAYPEYSKFDQTQRVFADIQILDADDNYDAGGTDTAAADPTSYKRYSYNEDGDGAYIWKDPSMAPHSNLDYSDIQDAVPTHGGPGTKTPGIGLIDTASSDGAEKIYPPIPTPPAP